MTRIIFKRTQAALQCAFGAVETCRPRWTHWLLDDLECYKPLSQITTLVLCNIAQRVAYNRSLRRSFYLRFLCNSKELTFYVFVMICLDLQRSAYIASQDLCAGCSAFSWLKEKRGAEPPQSIEVMRKQCEVHRKEPRLNVANRDVLDPNRPNDASASGFHCFRLSVWFQCTGPLAFQSKTERISGHGSCTMLYLAGNWSLSIHPLADEIVLNQCFPWIPCYLFGPLKSTRNLGNTPGSVVAVGRVENLTKAARCRICHPHACYACSH